MQVPSELLKSVAFVYCQRKSGKDVRGTAFFVSRPLPSGNGFQSYAVTARHVIDGFKDRTIDGKVYLRVNTQRGSIDSIETELSSWGFHEDSRTDVAALPISYDYKDLNIVVLPADMSLTDEVVHKQGVGPGDD